jgi:hypothetical protein
MDISDQLLDHLNTEDALRLMLAANLPGISSAQVQATFLPFATDLGFTSEAKGLFRKCHLCRHADYLFLMVPQALKHNDLMRPKREYASVVKRLETFFMPGNTTNVRAVHIFGY